MIGSLNGYVTSVIDGVATIVVNNVGYEVETALSVTAQDECYLHVHTHVTDDNIALYGFSSVELRARFRALIVINGIGPKAALAVCAYSDEEFTRAVKSSDARWFKAIKGIGPQSAERIIKAFR